MNESNKGRGKAAVRQNLEDTLSSYSEAYTKKVVGQLFDEYVKDGEYSYYADTENNYKYESYNYDEDYTDEDEENESGFYFGNTFSGFSKENLITDDIEYNNNVKESYSDNYDKDSRKESEANDTEGIITPPVSKAVNKNEYYEYDDFDDDFAEYDYEPKKKKKKEKKQRREKKKKRNAVLSDEYDYQEYDDILDRKKKEREAQAKLSKALSSPASGLNKKQDIKEAPRQIKTGNIIITDLTSSKRTNKNKEIRGGGRLSSLPPLKEKNSPLKEPSYDDVLKYSPRRRGGRNKSVKKKNRIPLSENRNIYPNKTAFSQNKARPKKARKKVSKSRLFFVITYFLMIIFIVFCLFKISQLNNEINSLKGITAQTYEEHSLHQQEILIF